MPQATIPGSGMTKTPLLGGRGNIKKTKNGRLLKSPEFAFAVIPAKAGIQYFQ